MEYYINVKFGVSNKTYYFATDDIYLEIGQKVVVDTIVGLELAEVTTYPKLISSLNYDKEIKPIKRRATDEDINAYRANEELAVYASQMFTKAVEDLKLDMRLIGAQYTLDKTKVLFTYVADDRVDFRELLKILAAQLHCRIELRQINSRERAQLVGGLGVCGLPLCCTTFFTQFDGVSLSKAKNQMLAINIPKLSGQCGKLMCCLKYEDDLYTEEKKNYPAINTKVIYEGKEYKINSFNILSKMIKLVNEDDVEFLPLEKVNSLLGKGTISHEDKKVSNELSKDKILYENKQVNKDVVKKITTPAPTTTKPQQSVKPQIENTKKSNVQPNKENKQEQKVNKDDKKASQKQKKQHQNANKKPAKQQFNSENNIQENQSKQLFAGQANKVKAYQEQYYKNNPQDKKKNVNNKPKENFKSKQRNNFPKDNKPTKE